MFSHLKLMSIYRRNFFSHLFHLTFVSELKDGRSDCFYQIKIDLNQAMKQWCVFTLCELRQVY